MAARRCSFKEHRSAGVFGAQKKHKKQHIQFVEKFKFMLHNPCAGIWNSTCLKVFPLIQAREILLHTKDMFYNHAAIPIPIFNDCLRP